MTKILIFFQLLNIETKAKSDNVYGAQREKSQAVETACGCVNSSEMSRIFRIAMQEWHSENRKESGDCCNHENSRRGTYQRLYNG